jgi:hypothetical protein
MTIRAPPSLATLWCSPGSSVSSGVNDVAARLDPRRSLDHPVTARSRSGSAPLLLRRGGVARVLDGEVSEPRPAPPGIRPAGSRTSPSFGPRRSCRRPSTCLKRTVVSVRSRRDADHRCDEKRSVDGGSKPDVRAAPLTATLMRVVPLGAPSPWPGPALRRRGTASADVAANAPVSARRASTRTCRRRPASAAGGVARRSGGRPPSAHAACSRCPASAIVSASRSTRALQPSRAWAST